MRLLVAGGARLTMLTYMRGPPCVLDRYDCSPDTKRMSGHVRKPDHRRRREYISRPTAARHSPACARLVLLCAGKRE